MPKFSKQSEDRLKNCHQDLQELFNEVIKFFDCSIICGTRNQQDQEEAFKNGTSKLQWPYSPHNSYPSRAVDVAPYPVEFDDIARFYHFAGFVFGVASQLDIKIRWGGDWDMDKVLKDNKFNDLPHFEVVE